MGADWLLSGMNGQTSAHTGKLAHGELNSNFDHDGGYICERWWFT
jgi:peptide/nickel transport system substrate-binding protein